MLRSIHQTCRIDNLIVFIQICGLPSVNLKITVVCCSVQSQCFLHAGCSIRTTCKQIEAPATILHVHTNQLQLSVLIYIKPYAFIYKYLQNIILI